MAIIFLFDLMTFLTFNYLAYSFLPFRFKRYLTYMIFLLGYFFICLTNFNGVNSLKATLLFFIDIIYITIQYKGSFFSKSFVIIPFFTFQIFSEIFIGYILTDILLIPVPKKILSFSYLLGLCLSFILLVIFNLCYIKLYNFIYKNEIPKYSWIIFITPLMTIFLLVGENNYFKILKDFPQYGTVIILFILSNILTAYILFLIIRSTNIKANLIFEKHKTETLELKYQLISQHYSYNFNFLHELLHTYTDINQLIEEKKYEETKKKINILMDNTYKEFNSIYSNSIVLNYLINERLQNFKNNNICCTTVIEDEKINTLNFDIQYELFNLIIQHGEKQAQNFDRSHRIILIKAKTVLNNLVIQCIIPYKDINLKKLRNQLNLILKDYKCIIDFNVEELTWLKILINFLELK